jgi:hypothetical protein
MKLPLLDFVSSIYEDIDFTNTLMISCTHILESLYTMHNYLFERKLQHSNLHVLGKAYSTNESVFKKYVDLGVNVHSGSKNYKSYTSFDTLFENISFDFLKNLNVDLNCDLSHYFQYSKSTSIPA